MFRKLTIILIPACLISFTGCRHEKQSQQIVENYQKVNGPGIIIYKTKSDYLNNVPVILSADKKTIVSYPATTDVYTRGKLAVPTLLENGFLLDNRGISKDAAFLKLTYEQYAALTHTPTPDELEQMILDPDPFTVMYDCGKRSTYKNPVEDINTRISNNDFSMFKKLK
jgi:hypothetical protein